MHIAIDITPTVSGHKARGVGKYTQLLIDALKESRSHHSFRFFVQGEKLPQNIDLVHYPYFDPFFLTLPFFQPIPFVVTVHDLIPLCYPDKFPKGIRGEIKWQIQRFSLKQSRRIITDSLASKTDIKRLIGYSEHHIDVVPLAPSPLFQKITDRNKFLEVRKRHRLPNQFILYVGDVNWNKNVTGLIRAFDFVRKTLKVKLVLVGKAFLDDALGETQEINRLIHSLGLSEEIITLGFVSDEDLVTIYNLASVYVQPSFAEGFGFPVLEAMACGCPVVSSGTSSLAEIAGPAIIVNPVDPSDIARGIDVVLRVKDRSKLSHKAIDWAKQFTWERVARQTIEAYEKSMA